MSDWELEALESMPLQLTPVQAKRIAAELLELRRENQMLRDNLRSMVDRVANQSELLSRKAERT